MPKSDYLYRQRLADRLRRQIKRCRQARALEEDQFQQQRLNSARIYSRRRKHLKHLEEE